MRLLFWLVILLGYAFLPRFWGPGWVVVGSAPTVNAGDRNPASWTLYIFNLHNHTRVVSAAVRFADGRTFVVASEAPDTLASLWSFPSVRTVSLTLPPEAWWGRTEGPHRFTLEFTLSWPRASGMPWAYRFEQMQAVRTWRQTLQVVKN